MTNAASGGRGVAEFVSDNAASGWRGVAEFVSNKCC